MSKKKTVKKQEKMKYEKPIIKKINKLSNSIVSTQCFTSPPLCAPGFDVCY